MQFIAILGSDGSSATVTTRPVKITTDSVLGSSLSFRERVEIPLDTSAVSPGVSVNIRSTCGRMNVGHVHCRSPRQWMQLEGGTGEVRVHFTVVRPLSTTPPKHGSPSAGRPGSASRNHAPLSDIHAPEWAGTLKVNVKSATGIAVAQPRASLFATAHFALQEKSTVSVATALKPHGHCAQWADDLVFDVPTHANDTSLQVRVWLGTSKQDAVCIGTGTVDIMFSANRETVKKEEVLMLPAHPRGQVTVHYKLAYHRPLKEGVGGRPMSAYSRNGKPRPTMESWDSEEEDGLGILEDVEEEDPMRPTSATKLRSKVVAGRATAWGDDSDGISPNPKSAVALEAMLRNLIAEAMAPVMQKLQTIEQRVQKSEEAIYQLQHTHMGGGMSNSRPTSAKMTSSRPSSAESCGASYDVSQSFITENQLRSKFFEYDTNGQGFITKEQLIHFYRSTYSFAGDEDDSEIIRFLAKHVRSLSANMVTFDEFARVALKLAQR